jgi:hypothetical protein
MTPGLFVVLAGAIVRPRDARLLQPGADVGGEVGGQGVQSAR